MIRKTSLLILGFITSVTLLYGSNVCSKWAVLNSDEIYIILPACNGDVPPIDDEIKAMYLDAINTARSQTQDCGSEGVKPAVSPLTWNDMLYTAAYRQSYDLAYSNTFSHTGSGTETDVTAQALHPGQGSTTKERIEYAGYIDWKAYGENLAAGTTMDVVQEAIDAWLSSPGHCANLMNPDFTEVGMAHVENVDSDYLHYWAQVFGKR
jgi:uncharacterized protein YkwD